MNKELEKANIILGKLTNALENNKVDDGDYRKMSKQKTYLEEDLASLIRTMDTSLYKNCNTEEIVAFHKDAMKKLTDVTNKLNVIIAEKDLKIKELSKVKETIEDYEKELSNVTSFATLEEYREKYESLIRRNGELNELGLSAYQTYNIMDIRNVIMLIDEYRQAILEIRNYGVINVTNFKNKYSGPNGKGFLTGQMNKLAEIISIMESSIAKAKRIRREKRDDNKVVLLPPPGCKEKHNCPLYSYFKDIMITPETDDEIVVKENKLREMTAKMGEIDMFMDMSKIITNLNTFTEAHKGVFFIAQELGVKLNTRSILEVALDSNEPLRTESDILTGILGNIDLLNEYTDNIQKIRELSFQIKIFEKDEELSNRINEALRIAHNNKFELEKELALMSDNENRYHMSVFDYQADITNLDLALSFSEREELLNKDISGTSNILEEMEMKQTECDTYKWDIKCNGDEVKRVTSVINVANDSLMKAKLIVMTFNQLTEESVGLSKDYAEKAAVVEALSNKSGIPLLFQEVFVQDTQIIMNDLLDTVYQGKLVIEDFEINEKEFRIPYTLNGLYVKDVSYASQGESSFIAIALAFALIKQSLKGGGLSPTFYNVILLDEIDATLDTRARRHFLDVLQKQMDSLECEQVFVISHNNMFEEYPVDVIYTSEIDGQKVNRNNIIEIR